MALPLAGVADLALPLAGVAALALPLAGVVCKQARLIAAEDIGGAERGSQTLL